MAQWTVVHIKEYISISIIHSIKIIGKERRNSYRKNEEISGQKAHTNIRKFNWNVSIIIDIFLDQKRVHVCSHTFTLFWSRKTSVIVKRFQLNFCVCVCVLFTRRSLYFFSKSYLFLFLFFVLSVLRYFPFHVDSFN